MGCGNSNSSGDDKEPVKAKHADPIMKAHAPKRDARQKETASKEASQKEGPTRLLPSIIKPKGKDFRVRVHRR